MHLAIAEEYMKHNFIKNRTAFLDGTLEPDLLPDKISSHFGSYEKPKSIRELLKSRMSLEKYVRESEITSDFEKGYFLHMIVDDLFYEYIYSEDIEQQTPEQAKVDMYSDYDFVTHHILLKYKIEKDRIKQFLNSKKGTPVYFTAEDCDKFISATGKIDLAEAKELIRADVLSFREKFFRKNNIIIKRNKIKGVIFDKDGLMINTEQLNAKAFGITIKSFNIKLEEPEAWYYKNCSGNRRDKVAQTIKTALPKNIEFSDFVDSYMSTRTKLWDTDLQAKKGLLKLLKHLKKKGIKLAVATSGTESDVLLQFEKAGIPMDYFSVFVYGFEVKEPKPHPATYQMACSKLGERPENLIALEDSDIGLISAHKAGLRVILIPDVQTNSSEVKKLAFYQLKSLDELIGLV